MTIETVNENGKNIPDWLSWAFVSVKQVGFPILACYFMWQLCTKTIEKNTEALVQNTAITAETKAVVKELDQTIKGEIGRWKPIRP